MIDEGDSRSVRELPVSVYSDYTCPWCYIGAVRLKKLEQKLAPDVRLDVRWEPFEIHPEVPDEGMPVESLPYSRERWEAMMENLRRQGAEEGLELGARPKVSNTHRALAASAWVQREQPEVFEEFHRGLFRAYFGEGRDLGDPDEVREVARECDVDVEALDAALTTGRYDRVLEETTARAHRLGITGTPTFVFDGRYAVVGAQPVEVLERVADRALEREGPE